MNTNELIDELENTEFYDNPDIRLNDLIDETIVMLRQQQTEIESLKSEIVSIEKNTDYWADKANLIKNNKPLAWMQTWENQDGELKKTVNIEQIGKNDIPLYSNPAELTDEEIIILWNDLVNRTVLRKASEK